MFSPVFIRKGDKMVIIRYTVRVFNQKTKKLEHDMFQTFNDRESAIEYQRYLRKKSIMFKTLIVKEEY